MRRRLDTYQVQTSSTRQRNGNQELCVAFNLAIAKEEPVLARSKAAHRLPRGEGTVALAITRHQACSRWVDQLKLSNCHLPLGRTVLSHVCLEVHTCRNSRSQATCWDVQIFIWQHSV